MSFFGFGGGALNAFITVHPTDKNSVSRDHLPTWKVRRNPFSLIKLNKQENERNNSGTNLTDPAFTSKDKAVTQVFRDTDDISGEVILRIPPGRKAEHMGVQVQFFGRIISHSSYDGRPHQDFVSLSKQLEAPSVLYQPERRYDFSFKRVEKMYESYGGKNVSIRYFVRVVVERKGIMPAIVSDCEFIVQKTQSIPPSVNDPIKMEVGIEECLHIEFEYTKRKYHLSDCITGNIHFLLVQIKIKHMEIVLIRRESSGKLSSYNDSNPNGQQMLSNESDNLKTENQTLIKYEIMDGAPVRGEIIPVRLYLNAIPADLCPSYENIHNRFSVKYLLSLVLVDEEDRRYFKQSEIILWRKDLG
mmetsp:Transcript_8533/g.10953  ORF Transcript_8533/g.10953 Transcript_8533/m.10953 type:complete len:359 (-) Transcript_8533:266-1342(-)